MGTTLNDLISYDYDSMISKNTIAHIQTMITTSKCIVWLAMFCFCLQFNK